jgi:L-lactate dehydrogenase (cytochrome)
MSAALELAAAYNLIDRENLLSLACETATRTMRLSHCHNFHDFRRLARRRLPAPIFDYIDGAAEDEVTHRRNSASFEHCDLVPRILCGVETVDLSVTVMGQKLAVPFYCSPTALQRLFHHQGERAVAAAAANCGTMFGVSSLGTVALEELRKAHPTPQVYQFWCDRRTCGDAKASLRL